MDPGQLSPCWQAALAHDLAAPYFQQLCEFVAAERQRTTVYPPAEKVFAAFAITPLSSVRVLLLGQDPYHEAGQACGLSFSVPPDLPLPPSLRNIFQELVADIGCAKPAQGCLKPWARQGVLLLNTVLTVRAGQPNAHQNRGWEQFTDAAITVVNQKQERVVFVLWGARAQEKGALIDPARHVVLAAPHPSPLSAYRGFFGSRPFSRVNSALVAAGHGAIDWVLPSTQAHSSERSPTTRF